MYKLSKGGILRKNKNFQAVYKLGKSYANRLLVLYVKPNCEGLRRAGFVTGKRLGGAVVRNRARRLMKEAYRLNQHQLAAGIDLVFIARQPIVKADFTAVCKALLELCGKAQLFNK